MSSGNILVIAPSPDFRHSLTFALETEGYVVTSRPEIPMGSGTAGFDAVVLDHKAARGERRDVLAFCAASRPVVLLAGQPQPWLIDNVFRAVPTPLMGNDLTSAVADALAAGHTSRSH